MSHYTAQSIISLLYTVHPFKIKHVKTYENLSDLFKTDQSTIDLFVLYWNSTGSIFLTIEEVKTSIFSLALDVSEKGVYNVQGTLVSSGFHYNSLVYSIVYWKNIMCSELSVVVEKNKIQWMDSLRCDRKLSWKLHRYRAFDTVQANSFAQCPHNLQQERTDHEYVHNLIVNHHFM